MAEPLPLNNQILICAGDTSGDIHGAKLIEELKKQNPKVYITSMGGQRMQELSDKFLYNLVDEGAAGFIEPFKKTFLWVRLINIMRKVMEEKRPNCFVPIDFYGFNHQILGLAAHRNIPSYYFIGPQAWASRPKRAQTLARLTKKVLVIFPFEKDFYEKAGASAEFVGHPLLDLVPEPAEWPETFPEDYRWKLGIMPGSREKEIKKHMPLFAKSAKIIKEAFPSTGLYIFATPEISDEFILDLCGEDAPDFTIVRETDYETRSTMNAILTCSGTATLENTLLGIPMAVAYQMNEITYQIAKRVVTVPNIALPNILLKKTVVKEFIQREATPKAVAGAILKMMQNPKLLKDMRKQLLEVRSFLGEKGAYKRAAHTILTQTGLITK